MQSTRKYKESSSKSKLPSSTDNKRIFKKAPLYLPPPPQLNKELRASLKNIYSLNDIVLDQACQAKDFHGALRVLHQVEAAFSDCQYGSNKRLYYLNLSVFYNNKAFVLGELQHEEQCCRMMERSIKNYEAIFSQLITKQDQIAFSTLYLKLNLRYCAILSHTQRHLDAVANAEKCLLKISQLLCLLSSICSESLETARDTPETLATESDSRIKSERVNFKKIVIKEAQKILLDIQELPPTSKLVNLQKDHFEQKIKNMYFWKNNTDNNTKNIRKQLFLKTQSGERNLLGLQKSSSFLEQFNLGDLMSLDLMKMKLKVNTDAYYLLSAPKIIELVLLAAVCYFTIATQTRFSDGNLDVTSLKISEKYKKLNKDDNISKCKILHLKAIQLAGKYLPEDNEFFTHLINSFNKNYKCILDEIKQESEISMKQSINAEINETYYHRLDQSSKFDEPTCNNISTAKRKKRSVSKDKIVVGLKKKIRSNSAAKKL